MNMPQLAAFCPPASFVTFPAALVTPHVHRFSVAPRFRLPATHMARRSLRDHFRTLPPTRLPSPSPGQRCLAAFFCLVGFSLVGCSSADTGRAANAGRRHVPPPTLVAPGRALDAAEADAARDPACFALLGAGRSMEPIYTSGTAIVVREQSFLSLRPGMAVVYRSRHGAYVAHLVLEKSSRGWLALGPNNPEADEELITVRNFVGVIKAAYAPTPPSLLLAHHGEPDLRPHGTVAAALR